MIKRDERVLSVLSVGLGAGAGAEEGVKDAQAVRRLEGSFHIQ